MLALQGGRAAVAALLAEAHADYEAGNQMDLHSESWQYSKTCGMLGRLRSKAACTEGLPSLWERLPGITF